MHQVSSARLPGQDGGYTADKCEVWTSSQNGEAALAAAAEAAGLPVAKCDVHKMLLGGGFGRRARSEYVSHAVRIAKEMPRTPIKLIKSREQDTANGVYHPITRCKLVGAFDAANNLTGMHMRISGQSILAAVAPSRPRNSAGPSRTMGAQFGYDANWWADTSARLRRIGLAAMRIPY